MTGLCVTGCEKVSTSSYNDAERLVYMVKIS